MTLTYIRISEVPPRLGISIATLYRWINEGQFVPPIKLGGRSAFILQNELHYFITETRSGRLSTDVVKEIIADRKKKSPLA